MGGNSLGLRIGDNEIYLGVIEDLSGRASDLLRGCCRGTTATSVSPGSGGLTRWAGRRSWACRWRCGHETVLRWPPNLADLGEGAGVLSPSFGPDTQAFMESPEGTAWLAAGDVRFFLKALTPFSKAHIVQTDTELLTVTRGAELLDAGILAEDLAFPVAEIAGIPLVALHSAPLRRISSVPAPLGTTRALPGLLNRATSALFKRVWWRGVQEKVANPRAQGLCRPALLGHPVRAAQRQRTRALRVDRQGSAERRHTPGPGA